MLGSLVPFLPVPYLVVVILLSSKLDPLTLGVLAGIGGSLGKITSYILGRSGYELFKPDTRKNMDALRGLIGKYGDIGVFIFAVSPLPDDIYLIPIGMMKYPFWRFIIANTAGKIVLAVGVAFFSRAYFGLAASLVGQGSLIVALAFLLPALVIITILLLRIDWYLVATIVRRDGWKAVLARLPEVMSVKRKKTHSEEND
ncbi:MAG: VTT domain-containing protein [Thaumarchaeota archaeon]|nr:VTT domain-containing protein [Nitrososphaerota archaeon]